MVGRGHAETKGGADKEARKCGDVGHGRGPVARRKDLIQADSGRDSHQRWQQMGVDIDTLIVEVRQGLERGQKGGRCWPVAAVDMVVVAQPSRQFVPDQQSSKCLCRLLHSQLSSNLPILRQRVRWLSPLASPGHDVAFIGLPKGERQRKREIKQNKTTRVMHRTGKKAV